MKIGDLTKVKVSDSEIIEYWINAVDMYEDGFTFAKVRAGKAEVLDSLLTSALMITDIKMCDLGNCIKPPYLEAHAEFAGFFKEAANDDPNATMLYKVFPVDKNLRELSTVDMQVELWFEEKHIQKL